MSERQWYHKLENEPTPPLSDVLDGDAISHFQLALLTDMYIPPYTVSIGNYTYKNLTRAELQQAVQTARLRLG